MIKNTKNQACGLSETSETFISLPSGKFRLAGAPIIRAPATMVPGCGRRLKLRQNLGQNLKPPGHFKTWRVPCQ